MATESACRSRRLLTRRPIAVTSRWPLISLPHRKQQEDKSCHLDPAHSSSATAPYEHQKVIEREGLATKSTDIEAVKPAVRGMAE